MIGTETTFSLSGQARAYIFERIHRPLELSLMRYSFSWNTEGAQEFSITFPSCVETFIASTEFKDFWRRYRALLEDIKQLKEIYEKTIIETLNIIQGQPTIAKEDSDSFYILQVQIKAWEDTVEKYGDRILERSWHADLLDHHIENLERMQEGGMPSRQVSTVEYVCIPEGEGQFSAPLGKFFLMLHKKKEEDRAVILSNAREAQEVLGALRSADNIPNFLIGLNKQKTNEEKGKEEKFRMIKEDFEKADTIYFLRKVEEKRLKKECQQKEIEREVRLGRRAAVVFGEEDARVQSAFDNELERGASQYHQLSNRTFVGLGAISKEAKIENTEPRGGAGASP